VATKSEFTEEEWDSLRKGVTGAGLLVSVADRDFTDTFGEAGALAKHLREEHEQNASELVRDLSGGHGTGFGFTASPQKVEAETLEALRHATSTLSAKAPEEKAAYRQLVLDVATAVANAKGGVKSGEEAAIQKVTAALDDA
jgi:tellurite resistance protein